MPYLDQETIRLLDDVQPGWVIEIVYNLGDRDRMAIGQFEKLDTEPGGDWAVYRANNSVGIKLIDVVSITRVTVETTGQS